MVNSAVVLDDVFLLDIAESDDPCKKVLEVICGGESIYGLECKKKNSHGTLKVMHGSNTGIKYSKARMSAKLLKNCGYRLLMNMYKKASENIARNEDYLRSQGQNPKKLARENNSKMQVLNGYLK